MLLGGSVPPSSQAAARHSMKATRMNLIAKLLPAPNVVLDLDVSSKKRVFEQAGLLFENNQQHRAQPGLRQPVRAREAGLDRPRPGIAIPHGRIKGMKDAVGAFVRTAQPIPFDAPDGKPVNLIFVLLVPERATDLHLQILSELAQMFSDKHFAGAAADGRQPRRLHQADRRMAAPCRKSA